jgi:predicted lipoprotein with Yx(FWY)xxD motif
MRTPTRLKTSRSRWAVGATTTVAIVAGVTFGSVALAGAHSTHVVTAKARTPAAHAAGGPTRIGAASKSKVGKVLVNASGQTLYAFTKDPSNKSECNGSCASKWIPVLGQKASASSGVNSRLLGITKRSNGFRQVTYAKHPLYRYVGDKTSKTTDGEGADQFGGFWYALNVKGAEVKPKSSGTCDPVCSGY